MVGAAHVVFQGKTQEFEYLRLETRPDGVYYVAIPSGKKETPFKLTAITSDDADTIFTFTNPVDEFPQRILYRRGKDGWLYAHGRGENQRQGTDGHLSHAANRLPDRRTDSEMSAQAGSMVSG